MMTFRLAFRVAYGGVWRLVPTDRGSIEEIKTYLGLDERGFEVHRQGPATFRVEVTRENIVQELNSNGVSILSPGEGANWTALMANLVIKVAVLSKEFSSICMKLNDQAPICWAQAAAAHGIKMTLSRPGDYTLQATVFDNDVLQATSKVRHVHLGMPVNGRPGSDRFQSKPKPKLFEKAVVLTVPGEKNNLDRLPNEILSLPLERIVGTKVSTLEQLNGLLERVDPVVMERLRSPGYSKKQIHGKNLTLGGIGCALTHIKLWESVAKGNSNTLVLEDDIWIAPIFDTNMGRAAFELPKDFSILYLGTQPYMYNSHHSFPSTTSWRRVIRGNYGTFAYIISPAGAQKLLDAINVKLTKQIDAAIVELTESDSSFTAYVLDPPVIYEIKTLRKSSIQQYD
mmetsp:Transcript_12190/g.26078  ORF Transcript_12190/g.26078 Transcript_12190/m.26078 type:complete len:399 (-) Transcript_12190:2069-3265(-)